MASVLTVYKTARVPPLLTTTQDSLRDIALVVSLYRVGLVTHRVSLRSFNWRIPSSWAYSWRHTFACTDNHIEGFL